jgi:transcriptional regulator with XRE-family HTH domain
VKGGELRRWREEQGWSQDELARLLKASLGKGSSTTVGKWENGVRPVPEDVSALVAKLQLEAAFPDEPPLDEDALGLSSSPSPVEGEAGDSVPPEPGERSQVSAGQLPLPGGGSYARVCEELWELVATGVGMVGAVTGSEGLRRDGEILHADRVALGRAWGKLAETNDTFRRMILGATTSGAWLEVAMVSGITFGKCYRSHQEIGQRRAAEREQQLAELGGEEVADLGFADAAAA